MTTDAGRDHCQSCMGTGESPSEVGILDCPDCGGSGILPPHGIRVEWRAADILRAAQSGEAVDAEHAQWLLAELRRARAALTEIIALAHDAQDADSIAPRIRYIANRALGLYELRNVGDDGHPD